MFKTINGIQHIGIGVLNHADSWKWYRQKFGMDICFFNGAAEAPLMLEYTRKKLMNKQAAMISNLHGGCAIEVVCPISNKPALPKEQFELGDIGIFVAKIKSPDVAKSFSHLKNNGVEILGDCVKSQLGGATFFVKDLNGLIFQVEKGDQWFIKSSKNKTGGPTGVIMGVSNMDESLKLYSGLLGYDKVLLDETGVFEDFKNLPGGHKKFRRILLTQSNKPGGGFAEVTGATYIELVQAIDYLPKKIFKGRQWGDVGFVHLGFDVRGMKALGEDLSKHGFGFTCDTDDPLTMGGSTRVHCTYIEDPDGILIELIEVFKIPIIEKLGIYLNVQKRDPKKPLPRIMLKAMKFGRIKD